MGSLPAFLLVGTFSTENVTSCQGHIEWRGLELIRGRPCSHSRAGPPPTRRLATELLQP